MSNTSRRRSEVITIFTGDYLSRIKHLEAKAKALEAAYSEETRRLSDVPEYLTVAEEHDALVAEAEETATKVRVQAPRRSAWKRLVAEHPPRTDKDEHTQAIVQTDEFYGFNSDTLPEALAKLATVEVDEAGEVRAWANFAETEMDDFFDDLAEGDFRRIWQAAVMLYRSVDDDPKANLASRMSQESDAT